MSGHSIVVITRRHKLTAFFRAALDAKAKKALMGILDEVDPDDAERRMNTFRSAFS
jgi:hypothetical protein